MSARARVGRLRAELEMAEASADIQERLAAAKQAYDADPTPETLKVRREAMAETHHFRSTFRGIDYLRTVRAEVAAAPQARAQLKAALGKMTADDPDRPKVEAKLRRLARLEAALPDLEAEHGPTAAYFEAMRGATTPAPQPTTAPGRVKRGG